MIIDKINYNLNILYWIKKYVKFKYYIKQEYRYQRGIAYLEWHRDTESSQRLYVYRCKRYKGQRACDHTSESSGFVCAFIVCASSSTDCMSQQCLCAGLASAANFLCWSAPLLYHEWNNNTLIEFYKPATGLVSFNIFVSPVAI